MLFDIRRRFNLLHKRRVALHDLQSMHEGLLEESALERIYIILIVGSCVIATFGLLSNSAAVIIGAMIVAPLMLPIRAMAFGALEGNFRLFRTGLSSIIVGTLLAIAISWLIGMSVGLAEFGSEIFSRSRPTLLDLGIAIAAGGISGFAKVEPKVSPTLAGTAISVALMPPICVIGLGLSQANWSLSFGATILYLTNLLGITLSCMLIFLATGYTPLYRAKKALIWTVGLTTVLLVPLGFSFFRLTQQNRLEASLRRALLNRTVTFQRLVLIDSNVNWLSNPPVVRLSVRSRDPVTPRQVELLEEFLARETGQRFTLIFEVGQIEEVRREGVNGSSFDE